MREIAKYIYFLSHRCWNCPTCVIFSTLNLQNQIYISKWNNSYNIALYCGMYSGLIFSHRSYNFFLPFTCLCLFFWCVVIPRFLPLWTLFSSFGALCLFLSGSLSCLLDLLLGSGSLVLVPWSWSPGPGCWSWSFNSGPLVPLALMLYCCLPGRWLHCIM